MSYKIVLDVGGTQIKSAVLDENSNLVTFNSIPTPNNITDFILDEVIQIVEQYKELYHLDPVYVGISS
ncbi:ROK family protein, partial [Staphylococcus arlettae]